MRPVACCAFLLLLLLGQEQARAKPLSSLQGHQTPLPLLLSLIDTSTWGPREKSLSRLLDEDFDHPLGSDDMDHDREDTLPIGALDPQDSEPQWARGSRDQPEGLSMNEQAVQKLFSDLMGSSRRYRGRSKKGLYRGCFGVKLDRIGSMSGLGC